METENPTWTQYLNRVSKHVEPQKQAGNYVKQLKGKAKRTGPQPESAADSENITENTTVQKAMEAKIVYNARREKLKMEQDEIKINAMKLAFVDKGEAEYWLSFIQREITDSFSVVKHCLSEVKRCIMIGEDGHAERVITNALIAAFERTAKTLQDALSGKSEDD